MNNYKFCILAAGQGTRIRAVKDIHKALLPLENRAALSHIIERVPEEVEIVIAVGFRSEQIKTYVDLVWPDRKITYVDVENYDGAGSGPGLSLYSCREHLQCPFVFTSADTITEENYHFGTILRNWVGVDDIPRANSSQYCLVRGNRRFEGFYYGNGDKAFIGTAGIVDYEKFWTNLGTKDLIKGEHQVLNGFKDLDMDVKWFKWYDTGNPKAYERTKNRFFKEIVAAKDDECIFIENGKVIKFFSDPSIVNTRVKRVEYLNGTVPKVKKLNDHMYWYDMVPGKTLSEVTDEIVLRAVIPYWYDEFTKNVDKLKKTQEFENDCMKMYHNKTVDRCMYFAGSELDQIKRVNGVEVYEIGDMLEEIDWGKIIDTAIPANFHGDFQPENIICKNDHSFKLIDWRQSFGKSLEVGDLYYDLGKMYHALLINGQDVNKKMYSVKIDGDSARVSHHIRSNLLFLLKDLKKFCKENDLSWANVKLLGILQYLGIASLYQHFHGGEYGKFLFLHGKYLLSKYFEKN